MPNKLKEIKKYIGPWKSFPFTSRREEVVITEPGLATPYSPINIYY